MKKLFLALLFTLSVFGQCPSTWSNYSYQQQIRIDPAYVSGSGTHSNFPVVILINDDANLKLVANGGHVQDGNDIRFFTTADVELDQYRIKYDGGAAQGDLYVYVEANVSTSAYTYLCMRYGRVGDSAPSSAANTFPSLVHYWPMDTANSPDVVGGLDVTSAGDVTTATGKVNLALTYDGTGDWSDTASGGTNPNSLGDMAISAWATFDNFSAERSIFSQQDGTGTGRTWLAWEDSVNKYSSALGGSWTSATTTPATSTWVFIAAEYDGSLMRVTANGADEGTVSQAPESATGIYRIGRHKTLTSSNMVGDIDELMIWSEDKGADWWLTMYQNIVPGPGTFYEVGAESTPAGGSVFPRRPPVWMTILFWRNSWLLDYAR